MTPLLQNTVLYTSDVPITVYLKCKKIQKGENVPWVPEVFPRSQKNCSDGSFKNTNAQLPS